MQHPFKACATFLWLIPLDFLNNRCGIQKKHPKLQIDFSGDKRRLMLPTVEMHHTTTPEASHHMAMDEGLKGQSGSHDMGPTQFARIAGGHHPKGI